MKRHFYAVLFLLTILLFALVHSSCTVAEEVPQSTVQESEATETEESSKETKEASKETEESSASLKPLNKPLTMVDIDAIPIATGEMSSDQLRQICVDYFTLQLTFPWKCSEPLEYTIKSTGKEVVFEAETAFAGFPYVTNATGNLYRLMKYYDPETGYITIEGDPQNFVQYFGNQCSFGAGWAWARVCNNTSFTNTVSCTPANGCKSLGPYVCDQTAKKNSDTLGTCEENGEQTMYESYALCLAADGLVTNFNKGGKKGNHVVMVREAALVVRDGSGRIDGEKSTVTILDQTLTDLQEHETEENGVLLRQGNIAKVRTFADLYKAGYLPFTFEEFHGLAPVEKSEITAKGYELPADNLSLAKLQSVTLVSNYYISDVQMKIFDGEGKEVYHKWMPFPTEKTYSYRFISLLNQGEVKKLAERQDTVLALYVRLGTGELITVYEGSFQS